MSRISAIFALICFLEGGALAYLNGGDLMNRVFNTSVIRSSGVRDRVDVIVANKTSFTGKISTVGLIQSKFYTELIVPSFGNFQVTVGKIKKKSGEMIKKGDVIMELSSRELSYRTEAAQNEYLFNQECIDKLNLDKTTVSKQDYNRALLKMKKALSEYNSMNEMESALQIKAPFDGVLGLFEIREGEQVKTHQKIVNLVDTKKLFVDFVLDNSDISNITEGTMVEVLSLDKGVRCFAQIEAISPDIDLLTSKIKVRARIDEEYAHIFKHNLRAIVLISKKPLSNIFMVPRSSIIDDGHNTSVAIAEYTPYGHETKIVPVEICGSTDDDFAIKSPDIIEGEHIIYHGVIPRDGVPVEVGKICD